MSKIHNKIIFSGLLKLVTGLHVGSGRMAFETDATVMKDSKGNPYIPGSSLKGVIRTVSERMHQLVLNEGALKVPVCFLAEDNCNLNSDFKDRLEQAVTEEDVSDLIDEGICPACQLFGSTFRASKIIIHDSYFSGLEGTSAHTTVRHSVAIDRETGTAKEGAKYDYEVVDADQTFHFKIEGENMSLQDEKLLMIALNELSLGHIQVGGKSSRGLGVVRLEDLKVHKYNFDDLNDKKAYLTSIVTNEHDHSMTIENWQETILANI